MLDVSERRSLEEQLRQAQKMEAVGSLAGGVAHDFNNLLTVIMGQAGLLRRRLEGKGLPDQDVDIIEESARWGADLTRQLVAFSRKQVLQPKVLDLTRVVRDMSAMLRRVIGEHIQLVTVFDPTPWHVKADPGQLEQVIVNLVVNARDAMPAHGRLTVETANVELDAGYQRQHPDVPAGQYVMLAVSDTGCGMDSETQARIFEPFFTTKGRGKGTGLGLSTVYGIVKQSGGTIWVYSEAGRGSTFKIYLPRVLDARPEVEPKQCGVPEARGSETILVAEDDDRVRAVVLRALRSGGYTVL
jgi:signal transduction histidine kinase